MISPLQNSFSADLLRPHEVSHSINERQARLAPCENVRDEVAVTDSSSTKCRDRHSGFAPEGFDLFEEFLNGWMERHTR